MEVFGRIVKAGKLPGSEASEGYRLNQRLRIMLLIDHGALPSDLAVRSCLDANHRHAHISVSEVLEEGRLILHKAMGRGKLINNQSSETVDPLPSETCKKRTYC